MKDIIVMDHLNLIGENNIDEETRNSYQAMAGRLRKLAKRNMRVLLRKTKIKNICQI
jgi:hypothetical protein